jgi:hypothetical protein
MGRLGFLPPAGARAAGHYEHLNISIRAVSGVQRQQTRTQRKKKAK